jgi:phospholipid/cholesterol/gamma-HCH transport system ATP-binding protein
LSVIRFESIRKVFDGQLVLDDFNLLVREAEMKIVIGGSGSGKSTILKMVLGLVRPDSGRITLWERDVTQLAEEEWLPLRGTMGMVFQGGALFDSLTVGENAAYRLREQAELDEEEIRGTVEEVLGFVGLGDAIDKMPSELSGGMRRRVAIARSLVGHPRIMLYDEPTAGLDPITSRTICELIMKLRDLDRVTSILVTHDLKAAHTMAAEKALPGENGEVRFVPRDPDTPGVTQFVMLERGKVLLEGGEEELLSSSDPYIREFVD